MRRVVEAVYYDDYKIIVTFNNGVKKLVDLDKDLFPLDIPLF